MNDVLLIQRIHIYYLMPGNRSVEEGIEIVDDYNSPRLKRIILQEDEMNLITEAVQRQDVDHLKKLLNFSGVLATKSKQFAQKDINKLSQEMKLDLLRYFWENIEPSNAQMVGMLCKSLKMWLHLKDEFCEMTEELACHDEWYVREVAAEIMGEAILADEEYCQHLERYARSDNVKLRRHAALCARAASRASTENFTKILSFVEPLMGDENSQITEIMATTTVASRFLKTYPEETINWLEKVADTESLSQRRCVILSFSHNIDKALVPHALHFIEKYLSDERKEVRNASEHVLAQLCKVGEMKVNLWLQNHMDSKAALEHWANLSATGALKSAEFLY